MKPTELTVVELAAVTGGANLGVLSKLLGRAAGAASKNEAFLDDLYRGLPPVRTYKSY